MNADDDYQLLQRCRNGDSGAYAEVYQRYGSMLYGTAVRMLTNVGDAEDAVQETFVRLVRSAPQAKIANLGGWLKRVVANYCIDLLRRRAIRRHDPIDDVTAGTAAGSGALRLGLRDAIAALPEGGRSVFLLHDVEGFRHREIAEMLGISVGTSKSQLFRARELLREKLGTGGHP